MNKDVEKIIGYEFTDKELLSASLKHSSYANEHNVESYEKLEFLGDALLDFIVGEYLLQNFDFTAGELSKNRAKLVSADKLGEIMSYSSLKYYIVLGSSMKEPSNNVLADIFESVLGAIYMDSNMTNAKKFVKKFLLINKANVERIINNEIDYKTALQEFIQGLPGKRLSMQFNVVKEENVENIKYFTVELVIGGKTIATERDTAIKKCEQKCSKIALEVLKK